VLSAEASAEPGRWRTDRVPYLREVMDAVSDREVNEVTFMASSQVAKTELILNVLGYYIDHDPAPMLIVQPTQKPMAESFSKERLAPMLRDTPCLRGKVADAKSRDSGNTILQKQFPGGFVAIAGANSPSSLASRPVRVVLLDEVDRFPESAGAEGDPAALAERRTETFWNRKVIRTSTPTIRSVSRIEAAFEEGDRRRYHVPCPDCGEYQPLKWANVVFDSKDLNTDAQYACEHCGVLIDHRHKSMMLRKGRWIAEAPFTGHASFHINRLYSPWRTWADVARDFLASKDDGERMRVFVNTSLGESYEEESEKVEATPLYRRREVYEQPPEQVAAVTFGVDVQADRFEIEFVGWGEGEESWSLHYERLYCDPTTPNAWAILGKALRKQFTSEDGRLLSAVCGCVDSGYLADEVYNFSRRVGARFAIPVKGASIRGKPLINFPIRPNAKRVYLTEVGTDTAKDVIYQRLAIDEYGAGYSHWPVDDMYDEEYFAQLTGEVKRRKYSRGHAYFEWHATRPRVEALDCRVYALAAVRIARQHFGLSLVREIESAPPPPPVKKTTYIPRPATGYLRSDR
jgi:phage terminase large subunit GpA-like protein